MGNRENLREEAAGELRALLARRRISASQLARQLNWKQSYMARRIDGRVALDLDDLQAIAAALETSVLELLPRSVHEQTQEPPQVKADPVPTTTPYVSLPKRTVTRAPADKRPRTRKPDGPPNIRRTSRTARPTRP